MNGAQRRLALLLAGAFLTIVALITVANAESMISDLRGSGVLVRADHVWSWEISSMIGWLSLYPLLWTVIRRVRPPRFGWPAIAILVLVGSLAASGWHIGVMTVLRKIYYFAVDGTDYHFFGEVADRLLYEFRKDFATYVQFVGLAVTAQWLIDRAGTVSGQVPPATLAVGDGAITHHVPTAEIERVTAAGNYVELAWGPRTLLHRATLAAVADELGEGFARIHRSAIVRRDAVRRVATERSGDFVVTLASGTEVRGSRRFRNALDGEPSGPARTGV